MLMNKYLGMVNTRYLEHILLAHPADVLQCSLLLTKVHCRRVGNQYNGLFHNIISKKLVVALSGHLVSSFIL